ncbi:MAG: hypothetical protein DWQ34_01865 [Planctomycetota bacterium]|nr:MAG: hypothetical protein DWQ29_17400 [Planctomycetota bacterium]REJ97558.1 MAG: hypothetical protein DWQ34_01865 [Planctomycetota bacterium]REK26915.1 MAG: hypothetical protein DWQ41_08745 [Planctomycetota bacterium]REK35404.1 MAG: hypothetical protein DWQ45_11860 [Planctomycetota bacterium]
MGLSTDQLAAVRDGKPVRIREDDVECVVVRADLFDRVRASLDVDAEERVADAYPLVNDALVEDDAQDPLLESYQAYRR